MEITIRPIEKRDYEAAVSLWNRELGNARVTIERLSKWYEKMEGDEAYRTFVAEAAGETVGLVTLVIVQAVDRDNGYLKINGLAVREDCQRRGIGAALTNRAEECGAERGANYALLNSGVSRHGAHAFYESRGYDRGSWCFTKRIL